MSRDSISSMYKIHLSKTYNLFGGEPSGANDQDVEENNKPVPNEQANDEIGIVPNNGEVTDQPQQIDVAELTAPNPLFVQDTATPTPVLKQSDTGELIQTLDPQYQSTVQLQPMEPTHPTLYTVPQGTYLYHGSTIVDTFDPDNIVLGRDTLVAYFSANKRYASDYINGCVLKPNEHGYIHKFRTVKDIDRIFIVSEYTVTRDWDPKSIESKYCNSVGTNPRYNGVGFFGRTDELSKFQDTKGMGSNDLFSAEFAICNPREFLQYVETEMCVSARKLSQPYTFTK